MNDMIMLIGGAVVTILVPAVGWLLKAVNANSAKITAFEHTDIDVAKEVSRIHQRIDDLSEDVHMQAGKLNEMQRTLNLIHREMLRRSNNE